MFTSANLEQGSSVQSYWGLGAELEEWETFGMVSVSLVMGTSS